MDATTLFILNLAVTLVLTGVIWFAQLDYYPQFGVVGRGTDRIFTNYVRQHIRHISVIAWTLLLIELITSFLLIISHPALFSYKMTILGFFLSASLCLSTGFIFSPYHRMLARGFNARIHRRLVWTNWFRVAAWTARSVILMSVISRVL